MKTTIAPKGGKHFSMLETCDKVSKISIYLLVFLLPILFLPWTANVLDFNKQVLLIVLALAAVFSWMLKILISGRASFNFSVVHAPIAILFLVYAVSSAFSLWRYGSFWGWPQVGSESLLTLLGLILLYFLIINSFERKEIFYLAVALAVSGFLAMFYGLLQIFSKFILPIGFTKAVSFNTVGSINALAVFAAAMIPLLITFLSISKGKKLKIFFLIATLTSIVLLLLVNFSIAWWIVIAGSALIIVFATQKKNVFDNRWLILPMFFLAVALLFSFFNFQIPGTPEKPVEVYLTQKASLDIAKNSLEESPLIGSGPGTFLYNFIRFKDIGFNQSALWNLKFNWASSKFLTVLATVGILGALAFLALIGFFIFYGIKFLFGKSYQREDETGQDQEFFWTLGMGIFVSFLSTTILYFFYQSNMVIDFFYFVLMACFVSLLYPVKKEIILKPSSFITLGVTFAFTLIFIFGLGILILEGQRYVSAVNYLESLKAFQENRETDAVAKLELAIRTSPKVDLYWREIAQVYLSAMDKARFDTEMSKEEATNLVQIYINSAVNAAKTATEVNPQNIENWSVRGYIYQNLIGVVGGTKDWAVGAYDEASKLEPANPYFPTQAGIAILTEAGNLPADKKEDRAKLITEAEEKFKKAIELKSDYASAHFQLALAHQMQGDQKQMAEELEIAKQSAPFDVGLAFQLGLIYYQTKDYEKAKSELERAVLLNPNYANALYFLGLSYDELGEKDKAVQVFERLRNNNPDNSLVIQIIKNLEVGEKALKGIVSEEPPVVPIEEETK